MNKILISNIQHFSLHDGPGIRTTVFLKGCSLRCPWCSNPENLEPFPQKYEKDGVQGIYGRWYEPEEVIREVMKDAAFYKGKAIDWRIRSADKIEQLPGGVSFSGGECLLQMPQLMPVLEQLQQNKVHMAIETCLFAPKKCLDIALQFIDFFYVDIKILDATLCSEAEHGNLSLYLDNLTRLFTWKNEMGNHKPVVMRIPVIGTFTDTLQNRNAVKELVMQYQDSILKIELLKEHNLGEIKYKSLNMSSKYHGVTDSFMQTYKKELETTGITTEICCF